MKRVISNLVLCFLILTAYSSNISPVHADDDDKYEEKVKEYEYKNDDEAKYEDDYDREYDEKYKDEDDYDHEYDEKYKDEDQSEEYYQQNVKIQEKRTIVKVKREYWYKWSRSANIPNEYATTPISSKQTVPIYLESKDPLYITAIPVQGQIFVPFEDTAKYLGASVTVYPNSQIGEIQLNHRHLIVKNGTRVAYENMKKTPMPLPIFSENGELYIPISVLANGLGFQVAWTKQQQIRIY
ncbi:copper amine oxidase N-terminal domain-containing protein [Anoxybacillus sp. J5B_2022]|uniref:copper amine oxidase N-terminal domain-containing protein n=1 Tax=Anoxybacillus sp. J5B_2022 TaxID=3003246 RepID=UPI0022861939|nr:copper amine oxidase N-terminal domain-containing protein [Anoxybacillus sp. J5B_2022]MCZ0757016.1 copper amine oxidase N-terminal domain-containing protein [Anoxybacillus sp. J5B_2022]